MLPVFYSFRRCPYAMRARLALQAAGTKVALREVVLRDKPAAFLAVSPSATVPCLVEAGTVIDESLDIMRWALCRHDPHGWLDMPDAGWALIEECDGPFKVSLDRTKYATRYPNEDTDAHRNSALGFLRDLDARIDHWIFDGPTLADFALLPFVRQFAFIDKMAFDALDLPALQKWLERFLTSDDFAAIMLKYPQWQPGVQEPLFPEEAS